MSFEIPDRIHIMPVGYEEDRLVEAADQLKADHVILIQHDDNDRQGQGHLQEVKQRYEELGIPYEVTSCDIFDLYDSLAAFTELIRSFSDQELYINIATGGKITAIAGMIAAMIEDTTVYYVQAEKYGREHIPRGVSDIQDLPRYPIKSPKSEHIKVLDYLNKTKDDVTKSDLIDFATDEQMNFLAGRDITKKAKYRLLDNHVIDPLLMEGYLDVKKEGRQRVIEITDDGIGLLKAFGHLSGRPASSSGVQAALGD